jgi:hypothetical protein
MIISHSKKFIFIHLEKCGGTSVETALEPNLHWQDIILGSTEFGEKIQEANFQRYGVEKVKKEMLWKHSTAENIHKVLGNDKWIQYKRFSVVRDPVELIHSLYWFSNTAVTFHLGSIDEDFWENCFKNNSFPNTWPYREKYVQTFVASQINHSGFEGFATSILNKKNDFVKPQIKRLKKNYSDKNLGKIVDLSTLNDEWENILDYIEMPYTELKQLNTSEYKEPIDISNKLRKSIKRHFAVDYANLPRYTGVYW